MADRIIRRADVVIAGGGASGLAAAIELGMLAPGLDVLVIEKMPEPGRKIRATGSGRCNITNTGAEGFSIIMEFFRRIGLVTRIYENGLVYPYSESAADVTNLLVRRAEELGVRFACGEEIMSVKHLPAAAEEAAGSGNIFQVESISKDRDGMRSVITHAPYVIMAMGGKSGPTFGTIGDGYRIARNLGHSVVTPVPALTSIECAEWGQDPDGTMMAGTRTKARVSLIRREDAGSDDGQVIFEENGEIQFTRYGLSGICVFNMTRCMRFDRSAGESLSDFVVRADLFPDGDIAAFLRERRACAFEGEGASDILATVLRDSVAAYVLKRAGIIDGSGDGQGMLVSELSDEDIEALRAAVHCLTFHPAKLRGWNDAQVTMGGVSLDEIDPATSGSLLISGLYITGELADRDYPCGGFNLSNAWLTGLAAADDIAGRL